MRSAGRAARRLGSAAVCVLPFLGVSPAAADGRDFSLGGSFDAALQPYAAPAPSVAGTPPPLPLPGLRSLPAASETTSSGIAGSVTYRPEAEIATEQALSLTASGAYIDPDQWSIGLGVGLNGFSVGGSYSTGEALAAQDTLDLEVSYSTGAWSFGFAYQNQESAATESQEWEENTRLEAGLVYSLGPRFNATASAVAAYNASDPDSASEIDDLTGVLGFSFRF